MGYRKCRKQWAIQFKDIAGALAKATIYKKKSNIE